MLRRVGRYFFGAQSSYPHPGYLFQVSNFLHFLEWLLITNNLLQFQRHSKWVFPREKSLELHRILLYQNCCQCKNWYLCLDIMDFFLYRLYILWCGVKILLLDSEGVTEILMCSCKTWYTRLGLQTEVTKTMTEDLNLTCCLTHPTWDLTHT